MNTCFLPIDVLPLFPLFSLNWIGGVPGLTLDIEPAIFNRIKNEFFGRISMRISHGMIETPNYLRTILNSSYVAQPEPQLLT